MHLPLKCVHCKGAHQAIFQGCPGRRAAIEEAKKKKQAVRDLVASRRRIQVIVPVKKNPNLPISQPYEANNKESEPRPATVNTEMTSQDETLLQ